MTEEQPGQMHWYVVHCQSLKERQVADLLSEQLGLKVYLPEVTRHFGGKLQAAPLFPRYLFARADLHEIPPSRINTMPGVARMVTVGGTPQMVPAQVLTVIQERLVELEAGGGLPGHDYRPGDTVQLRSGPLRGLDAVFLGPTTPSERVHILIEFLGRPREVDVDVAMLEGDHGSAVRRRKRRTRGKGRPVNRPVVSQT